MKQYRVTAGDFVSPDAVDDTVLDPNDLANLKKLAGIDGKLDILSQQPPANCDTNVENISHTAQEKADYMRKQNIKPGTQEWFKLWFTLPYLTNTKPF